VCSCVHVVKTRLTRSLRHSVFNIRCSIFRCSCVHVVKNPFNSFTSTFGVRCSLFDIDVFRCSCVHVVKNTFNSFTSTFGVRCSFFDIGDDVCVQVFVCSCVHVVKTRLTRSLRHSVFGVPCSIFLIRVGVLMCWCVGVFHIDIRCSIFLVRYSHSENVFRFSACWCLLLRLLRHSLFGVLYSMFGIQFPPVLSLITNRLLINFFSGSRVVPLICLKSNSAAAVPRS
jgi:hypothetical protein